MQNTSFVEEVKNPKLELLMTLRRLCYTDLSVNYSWIIQDTGGTNVGWCPRTFDGFSCWDEAPGGATAAQNCPAFVIGFDPRRLAYKECTDNGTWYQNPEGGRAWTNYTTCIDLDDLEFRGIVNNIYVVGYSISMAALLVSMIIFLYFSSTDDAVEHAGLRNGGLTITTFGILIRLLHYYAGIWKWGALQCTRVCIHMQLFSSFAVNSITWILWYKTVVSDVTVVQENRVWCQVLHVLTNYFMVSSYMWMFCESLHLHIALVVVFIKEEEALHWFMALGWGAPLAIVAAYAVVRRCLPHATEQCWMNHSDAFWIIIVPVCLSLATSFVFLVNVVRVLVTKLHPTTCSHVSVATRKAVRAALILIPLFGLHFILIPLRPAPDSPLEHTYQVVSALLTSLQGLCVAVLFCFTNHDVLSAAQTTLVRYFRAHDAVAITGLTAAESMMNTREHNF